MAGQYFTYDGDDVVLRQIFSTTSQHTLGSLSQPDVNALAGPGFMDVFYLYGPTGLVMEFDAGTQETVGDYRTLLFDPQGNCVCTSNGVPYADFVSPSEYPVFYDAYGAQVWAPPAISTGWYATLNRATSQPFQYKGQYGYYTDGVSGLIYCLHRFYDPNTGRWTQRDPTGLDGGVNVYAYCEGDPVGMVDPDGTDSILIVCGQGYKKRDGTHQDKDHPEWEAELRNDYVRYYAAKGDTFGFSVNETREQVVKKMAKYDAIIFIGHGNKKWGRLRGPILDPYKDSDKDMVRPELFEEAFRKAGRKNPYKFITLESCNMLQIPSTRDAYLKYGMVLVGYPGHENEPKRHASFPGAYAPGFPATYRREGG